MTIFMVLLFAFSDITNTFLLIYQLGACCIYVVFVADNLKALADHLLEKDNDIRLFMLIILLPLILINWVSLYRGVSFYLVQIEENIKRLFLLPPVGSKFEVFGSIFECGKCHYNSIIWHYLLLHVQWTGHNYWQACVWKFGWISILLWYSAFRTRSNWRGKFPHQHQSYVLTFIFFRFDDLKNSFFVCFSLLLCCDSIQIMPLENEMRTPKSFGGNFGVLNRSMIVIIFLYVGMGFFGYLKYGDHIAGSITLNLPQDEL